MNTFGLFVKENGLVEPIKVVSGNWKRAVDELLSYIDESTISFQRLESDHSFFECTTEDGKVFMAERL